MTAPESGTRFGHWTVVGPADPTRDRRAAVKVRCKCKTIRIVPVRNLKSGRSTSCGCERNAKIARARRVHGDSSRSGCAAEYRAWCAIKTRCYNQLSINFDLYGGRGIVMCDRWRNSYAAFLADMGRKPSPKHSIDRIDPNGNYEPGNCRWATGTEQRLNQRRRHRTKEIKR